jgi:hypothetical protein
MTEEPDAGSFIQYRLAEEVAGGSVKPSTAKDGGFTGFPKA